MSKKPDYEGIEKRAWRKNAKDVVPLLEKNDENLLKKIATFSKNFGYAISKIKEEIKNNEMFAATFAVIPSRQGFHEKTAADWLKNKLKVEVQTLPRGGKNALFVSSDGYIVEGQKPTLAKSLDFKWEINDYTFYAMHKYTRGSGGGQGTVSMELKNTLRNFSRAKDRKLVLIAIVDGSHYTEEEIEEIRAETQDKPPCSFACPIEDVPDIVERYK